MREKVVYEPALVKCEGPEHHRFTTEERVRQKAHYVANHDAPIGLTSPHGSLDKVRCPKCGHQVEAVTDEQGWNVRP